MNKRSVLNTIFFLTLAAAYLGASRIYATITSAAPTDSTLETVTFLPSVCFCFAGIVFAIWAGFKLAEARE